MKKITLSHITLGLVVGIVLAAFTLSFRTVAQLGNVFFPGYGWLFALLVDAGMAVLGLVRLQAGVIASQGLKYGAWGGLIASLVLSVLLNVVDAYGAFTAGWLHYVIHGLPPVALLSLSELALTMYDKQLSNGDDELANVRQSLTEARQALASATADGDKARAAADKLAAELDNARRERDDTAALFAALQNEHDKLTARLDSHYVALDKLPERAAYVARQLASGRLPNGDMTKKFGMGKTTVDKMVAALVTAEERAGFGD